ncbi:MAG TPA: DCC1-like thiol-disulfide oxidoreductase family protein [bacterium]|nr:DCC1-like thiol-disulfide oxidoreductase family protein [bacterium]HPG46116.1 DCC1-like thiol-disulfide oxidoreductase family protein [bacterium]HPM98256.1 DCC1-like thiol-disulfide oxidoreductase family protein [bacterium]
MVQLDKSADPSVRATHEHAGDGPILFFDGICVLCNSTVDAILRLDSKQIFRFAALQSPAATRLLAPYCDDLAAVDSVVLLEDGQVFTRSEAVRRIARRLAGLWPAVSLLLRLIPRSCGDLFYEWIAAGRYRLFGRRQSCRLQDDRWADRFIIA